MKNIEVENGEIAIRNKNGDIAIIPKGKANSVRQMIKLGKHNFIDTIVNNLPKEKDYAEDGTVIRSDNTKQAKTFREQLSPTKVPFSVNVFDLKQMQDDNLEQPPKKSSLTFDRDPNEERFYFTDRRKRNPVTDGPINPNKDLKSGFYNVPVVEAIVKEAETFNVDPNLALAIAMQESNLGNKDQNFGHVTERDIFENENQMSPDELEAKQLVYSIKKNNQWNKDYFLKTHKMTEEQFNKYPIETWRIQAYNGLGKLTANTEKEYLKSTGRNANNFYGIDVTKKPLDMKENPAYAKTILSIKEQIEKDPDFQRLINKNKSPNKILLSKMTAQR